MFKKQNKSNSETASGAGDSAAPKTASRLRKKGNKKKVVIICVIVVLVLAAILATQVLGGGDGEMAPMVATATVERGDIRQEISIKGTVKGKETANISSGLTAEVATVQVQVGDKVTQGQVLATLKQEEDQSQEQKNLQRKQEKRDLQAQYDTAKINLDSARAALESAQKAMSTAKETMDSHKLLFDSGAISKTEYDSAVTAYDNTVSAYESAQAALESSQISLSNIDARLKDPYIDNKINTDQYIIKSPINGTVTRVNTNPGLSASSTTDNQPMFVIEDLSGLQMKVSINEFDINKVSIGQEVTIEADILEGRTVSGVVSDISPTGELKAGSSSNEMVIPVVIDIDAEQSGLMAGVTAKATILTDKKENVLVIPIDGVLQDPETGESSVFVVDKEGKLKQVPVTVGLESNLTVEVSSDQLKEGDTIVLAPTYSMTDGMQVMPQTVQQ